MEYLKDLRKKDFIEQFEMLSSVEKEPNAIPELLELLVKPLGDTAVDYVVKTTLSKLLAVNEEATLQGLSSEYPEIRKLCSRIAGESRFESVASKLIDLTNAETNPDFLYEYLEALSKIRKPEFLEIFKRHILHPEALISALSIDVIAEFADPSSYEILRGIVNDAEKEDRYEICDLPTWKAIDALGAIKTPEAISFLVEKIHHLNPTARRLIHDALIRIGAEVLPVIAGKLKAGNVDDRIMAANIIGFIGDKKGADHIIEAFDTGNVTHPNVRFAMFEALGRIPALKSAVFLLDGLNEKDPLILVAIITGLERQKNPGVVARLKAMLKADNEKAGELLRAVIAAKAVGLFSAVYPEEAIGNKFILALEKSNDKETIDVFRAALEAIDGERAKADGLKLAEVKCGEAGKRILAMDDSEAMLHFYRSVVTGWGFSLTSAPNGREGLDLIELGDVFDVILVDMNMPVMDGIEFTRKVREYPEFESTPIVMITTETENSQADLAKKAGVNAFIKKPFKPDALKAVIDGFLAPNEA